MADLQTSFAAQLRAHQLYETQPAQQQQNQPHIVLASPKQGSQLVGASRMQSNQRQRNFAANSASRGSIEHSTPMARAHSTLYGKAPEISNTAATRSPSYFVGGYSNPMGVASGFSPSDDSSQLYQTQQVPPTQTFHQPEQHSHSQQPNLLPSSSRNRVDNKGKSVMRTSRASNARYSGPSRFSSEHAQRQIDINQARLFSLLKSTTSTAGAGRTYTDANVNVQPSLYVGDSQLLAAGTPSAAYYSPSVAAAAFSPTQYYAQSPLVQDPTQFVNYPPVASPGASAPSPSSSSRTVSESYGKSVGGGNQTTSASSERTRSQSLPRS